jgi:hypothetical protein
MSIDIAVQSRLHYAIRFNYLGIAEIRNILETFQDQLDDTNCSAEEKGKIRNWLKDNFDNMERYINGRDIRNLFMGTQLLSRKDGGKITLDHLQKIYRASEKFRKDMQVSRLQKEGETSVIDK